MTDGRHDFDFLHGRWRVHNRRLVDFLDPACSEWTEFVADAETYPILAGLGNIDRFFVEEMPADGASYEGMALRLFDPVTGTWRIWWAATSHPGRVDKPVEGRFAGGHGTFVTDDQVQGRSVTIRFHWYAESTDTARWEQAFSFDGRRTWTTNWIMMFSRRP